MRKDKSEELQNSAWSDERFNREQLYTYIELFLGSCA